MEGNAKDNVFKVYVTDIGLLIEMLGAGTRADILQGNLGGFKGAIYENLMAAGVGLPGADGRRVRAVGGKSEIVQGQECQNGFGASGEVPSETDHQVRRLQYR